MEKNASNQSIDRMFQIIEAMAFTGKPMRLNDIAEKSGIPASTAMRILIIVVLRSNSSQEYSVLDSRSARNWSTAWRVISSE